MATAREFWRPIINDFNPVGQVRPEDVARFFVDRKEDDPTRSLNSSTLDGKCYIFGEQN